MFEKSKALFELKKIQAALAKETIETEAGNGAVKVKINGEQKIQKVTLDPELLKDVELSKAEKMKAVAGGLGLPGL